MFLFEKAAQILDKCGFNDLWDDQVWMQSIVILYQFAETITYFFSYRVKQAASVTYFGMDYICKVGFKALVSPKILR